jgi:acetyl esterase/lipase
MSATTTWRRPLGRLILGACAAAALAVPALAQPAGGQAPTAPGAAPAAPAAPDPAATPHRDFPGDVVGLMDITYSRISGFRPLKLDLYMTRAKPATPRPVVLWLHGGGWNGGDQRGGGIATPAYRNWPGVMATLAARGYVVAGVSYRFSSEAQYPAQVQDVKAAIRWLRANAATYGIDPNKVIIWGASAGAQIGNVVGTSCNVPELEGPKVRGAEGSSCVQGVVDFYGPSDFAQAESQRIPGLKATFGEITPNASQYLGCPLQTCPADKLRMANSISFIDKSDPPFLIMHGSADGTVPPKQSQILYDALQKAGVKSELVFVPGVDHVFSGATDAQGKEVLDKVFAFLDATTGVKPAN